MDHPVFARGNVALITGAAMGIGLATARRLAGAGMHVCMVDADGAELEAATASHDDAGDGAMIVPEIVDVADPDALAGLKGRVFERFGKVDFLFNNAVTRVGGGVWEDIDQWRRSMDVNYWGPVHGVRTFVPDMINQGTPAMVVNAGSKQGITNPPGNLAYNVTKSALKHFTEGLEHELRNTDGCQVSAHLLVPGWTTTGKKAHQQGAWRADQVAEFMTDALQRGDFYIVCPDDEVTLEMDQDRILWAAGDITENRPPLSRWHNGYKEMFDAFAASRK